MLKCGPNMYSDEKYKEQLEISIDFISEDIGIVVVIDSKSLINEIYTNSNFNNFNEPSNKSLEYYILL